VNITAQLSRGDDSCTSSLGPSNSASQHTRFESASQQARFDTTFANAVKELLESVEAPSVRPGFLKPSVLWYYEDCQTDKTEGDIVTKANPHRPKMHLTVHHADGSKLARPKFNVIRVSAETIVHQLMECVGSDPRLAMHADDPKLPTKTLIKSLFPAEFNQAILWLKVQWTILRLCSAHWKAETMIGQVFLQRSEEANGKTVDPCSASNLGPSEPEPTVSAPPVLQVLNVAPVNTSKRALELSPGPKSPSALQAQKRSKDNAMIFGQKMTGFPVPSNHSMCSIQ
jgi:hypothetical protein